MGVQLVLTLRKFRSKKISIFAGYENESSTFDNYSVFLFVGVSIRDGGDSFQSSGREGWIIL